MLRSSGHRSAAVPPMSIDRPVYQTQPMPPRRKPPMSFRQLPSGLLVPLGAPRGPEKAPEIAQEQHSLQGGTGSRPKGR